MCAKKILSAAIIVATFFAISLGARQKSKPYDYPVKPGTKEWKAFTTHEQKRQACQIPQSVLNSMSTPDLVVTCLNYPLYGDMMAYDRVQEGFEYVKKGFNGLQELLKRNDVGAGIVELYDKMDPDAIDKNWTPTEKGKHSFKFFNIEILLAQDEVISNLSKKDRINLLREAHEKLKVKQQHPEIYGFMGFANNVLLMGRIMLKERYEPLEKLSSRETKLNVILQKAMPISEELMIEIVKLVEKYLKQK